MLEIDQAVFDKNLLLTQAYCALQLKNTYKNYASILRSFNPVYNGKELFSFELGCFGETKDGAYKFLTEWHLDPLKRENDYLYDDLFEKQLNHKKETIDPAGLLEFNGQVLIAEIDSVITDGVSEFESEGFIDYNDCPPIDTWFYIAKNEGRRVLFAWIPEPCVNLADKGIEVNVINTFNWYNEGRVESSDWHNENLGETPKVVVTEQEKPVSVLEQLKKMFS